MKTRECCQKNKLYSLIEHDGNSTYVVCSLVYAQSLKGRPPPAPLFGDEEDDEDLDWLN